MLPDCALKAVQCSRTAFPAKKSVKQSLGNGDRGSWPHFSRLFSTCVPLSAPRYKKRYLSLYGVQVRKLRKDLTGAASVEGFKLLSQFSGYANLARWSALIQGVK